MATTTTNYGMTKPAQTDYYDVDIFNGNADIADAALKDLEDTKLDADGDASNLSLDTITSSSASYPTFTSGLLLKTIFGRIQKFLNDLKANCVTSLSVSGKTITYTKAGGGTGTITTQDTTYSNATTSAAGLMSAADKTKLNGIAAGAQVNSVTGVKGNAESTYRTGQVNLTPANIGAAAASHNHAASAITSGTLSIDRLPTVTVAKGGTGATTVAGARNALGLGNTSGAVPVANGGTGATTVAGARNALGLGNTSGAVPVANGGTGATTVSAAQTNLGLRGDILSKFATVDVTSGTATNVVSVSLPTAGVYLIMARGTFSANSRGRRTIRPYMGTQGYAGQTVLPLSGTETEISSFDFVYVSSASTLYARAYQDSGATLSVSAWVGAYRVRT